MARHSAPADGTGFCGPFSVDYIVSSALSTLGITKDNVQFTLTPPTLKSPKQTPTPTNASPSSSPFTTISTTISTDSLSQSLSPTPTPTQSTLTASSSTQQSTPSSSSVPINTFVTDSFTDLEQATSTTVNIILESTVITGSRTTTTRIQTQVPINNSRKNAALPGVLGAFGAVVLIALFTLFLWRRRRKSRSEREDSVTPFISANDHGRNAKIRSFFACVLSKRPPVGSQAAATVGESSMTQVEPPTYSEALEQPASPAYLLPRPSGDHDAGRGSKSDLESPVG